MEIDHRPLLDVPVPVVAEQNRGHGCQLWVQSLRQVSILLQQIASLRGVGALLDRLPVLDLKVHSAHLSLEGLVGERLGHDAVDEIDRLRLLRFARLEGVGLDVLDRARVNLVAQAFVRTMVAFEFRLGSLRFVLDGKGSDYKS